MDFPPTSPPAPAFAGGAATTSPAASTSHAMTCAPNSARDEFRQLTVAVNHHLRTPLTVLVGHSELLTTHAEVFSPEGRASVHALDDAVRHLSDAVDRVCLRLHEAQTHAHS